MTSAGTNRRWFGARNDVDDDTFVQQAYLRVLGRPVDAAGRQHFVAQLANGLARTTLVEILRSSDEAAALAKRGHLPSLRARRPWRYRFVTTDDGVEVPVFTARHDRDFAWLERSILRNRYYERPGEWDLGDNDDKRRMADMVVMLGAHSVVEIGCSSGAVIGHLRRQDVDAVGIDISELAVRSAADDVREHITLGDVSEIDLGRRSDLVLGLDVFEHVQPRRVWDLIRGALRHLRPGGLIVANIPAFGSDAVFGQPFPMYLPGWRRDAAQGRPFCDLVVDADGYPLHGHLVWATVPWWATEFERHGLARDHEREALLQRELADHFARAPARRSMFVFQRRPCEVLRRPPAVRGDCGQHFR